MTTAKVSNKTRILNYLRLNAHIGCSSSFLTERLGYTNPHTIRVAIHNINRALSKPIGTTADRYYHPDYFQVDDTPEGLEYATDTRAVLESLALGAP